MPVRNFGAIFRSLSPNVMGCQDLSGEPLLAFHYQRASLIEKSMGLGGVAGRTKVTTSETFKCHISLRFMSSGAFGYSMPHLSPSNLMPCYINRAQWHRMPSICISLIQIFDSVYFLSEVCMDFWGLRRKFFRRLRCTLKFGNDIAKFYRYLVIRHSMEYKIVSKIPRNFRTSAF